LHLIAFTNHIGHISRSLFIESSTSRSCTSYNSRGKHPARALPSTGRFKESRQAFLPGLDPQQQCRLPDHLASRGKHPGRALPSTSYFINFTSNEVNFIKTKYPYLLSLLLLLSSSSSSVDYYYYIINRLFLLVLLLLQYYYYYYYHNYQSHIVIISQIEMVDVIIVVIFLISNIIKNIALNNYVIKNINIYISQ
jgi:hypothetical protein